jgi:hypothetical protein
MTGELWFGSVGLAENDSRPRAMHPNRHPSRCKMANMQRYISDELTHFVGRHSHSSDSTYLLLIKIIQSGWITHPPHDPTAKSKTLHVSDVLKLSSNQSYNINMVCFCDIPVEDFPIHMRKYSQFGIGFKKEFLIAKGANPVFYVANNSRLQLTHPMTEHKHPIVPVAPSKEVAHRKDVSRSEFFDEATIEFNQYITCIEILLQKGKFDVESRIIASLREYIGELPMSTDEEKSEERAFSAALGILELRKHVSVRQRFLEMMEFIQLEVLSYIKMFDDAKLDNDPDNYYMEREWRILGNVPFAINDVRRIILPAAYAERLRSDVPSYNGQVTFSQ